MGSMSEVSAKVLNQKNIHDRELLLSRRLQEEIDSATTFRSGVSVPEMVRQTIRVFRQARNEKQKP